MRKGQIKKILKGLDYEDGDCLILFESTQQGYGKFNNVVAGKKEIVLGAYSLQLLEIAKKYNMSDKDLLNALETTMKSMKLVEGSPFASPFKEFE